MIDHLWPGLETWCYMLRTLKRYLHESPNVKGDVLALFAGIAIALFLFYQGLAVPDRARLTGDAKEYMAIAKSFGSFGEIFNFVGDRTVGMPLFDWIFMPMDHRFISQWDWAYRICLGLLFLHLLCSGLVVLLARQLAPIRYRWSFRLMFVLVCGFPALVGYTTLPLTDTLAVDLMILALVGMLGVERSKGWLALVVASTIGFILAFACLVRPAYLIPASVAMALYVLLMAFKKRWVVFVIPTLFISLLLPISMDCKKVYGKLCLQDPTTFDAVLHAQMGLRGGRIFWGGPDPMNGEFPVLPDPVMKAQFYDRCHLKKVMGLDSTTLVGCLISRPHLLPIYLFKKWVSLFDHFRFQAFLESETPPWLKTLSRVFDSFAWIGFLFLLTQVVLRFLNLWDLLRYQPGLFSYLVFSFLMLSEHTILHPEDRFGLVVVPISTVASIVFLEGLWRLWQSKAWKQLSLQLGFALFGLSIFIWQIIKWDQSHF